jgi:hypothetical protein
MQLAVMVQKPLEASSVVDELLAEWTTLTEAEIAGVVEDEGPSRVKAEAAPVKAEAAPVRFTDAVGRKFSFPYHLFRTWAVSSAMDAGALTLWANVYTGRRGND